MGTVEVVLYLVLMVTGAPKPLEQGFPMENLEACKVQAVSIMENPPAILNEKGGFFQVACVQIVTPPQRS